MTTTDYLQREIRRAELSIRRAERKPNTPPEELRGLHEKLEHLQEALEAVNEHWKRVHEQRGWTTGEPLTLERLRKMVNTPVYVEDKCYPMRSAWGMVHDGFCDMQIDAYFFADYGERWVAYPCTFARVDREKWEPCEKCNTCWTCKLALNEFVREPCMSCGAFKNHKSLNFCPWCGRPLTEEAWAELERKVFP